VYLITWTDQLNGPKTLEVHTARAMSEVVRTLQDDTRNRYRDVRVTHIAPRRMRELVIVFEK